MRRKKSPISRKMQELMVLTPVYCFANNALPFDYSQQYTKFEGLNHI